MTREQKLISLLQPKDYVSKIKLYCKDCKFSPEKFVYMERKDYIRRVIINEIK